MRASETVTRRGTHHQQQHPNTAATDTPPYYSKLSKSHTGNTPGYLQHSTFQPQRLHPLAESFLDCFTWNNMTPYVIQGMYYFLRHKILWKTTFWPIFWALIFVICAIIILLPLAFIPQALVLSTVMTPFLGWPCKHVADKSRFACLLNRLDLTLFSICSRPLNYPSIHPPIYLSIYLSINKQLELRLQWHCCWHFWNFCWSS